MGLLNSRCRRRRDCDVSCAIRLCYSFSRALWKTFPRLFVTLYIEERWYGKFEGGASICVHREMR